jgi:hypothetical protein
MRFFFFFFFFPVFSSGRFSLLHPRRSFTAFSSLSQTVAGFCFFFRSADSREYRMHMRRELLILEPPHFCWTWLLARRVYIRTYSDHQDLFPFACRLLFGRYRSDSFTASKDPFVIDHMALGELLASCYDPLSFVHLTLSI